ncbi:hypothetical protein BKA67DRAFT_354957 [Truncatella angustata]|uniref:Uncharacterized protein n=1 Tax=Truncatella angustata TaxID=152316 RepID=A0A9P8ZWS2_9PEZI|nr:uncharacterized protein BKA67DRAFT_354957 [Truncatella angustata]KAH6652397.1 hypothetical protein BKA67DRAFT_354957 [Truncatella angustata]
MYNFDIYSIASAVPSTLMGSLTDMDIFAIFNRTAKPHFTYFVYAIERQIYLYTFCSVTVYLAFVILFSYVATVTVHMLIILFGRKWTSRAWPGLGEFLVLTLHSPPCVTPMGADILTGSGGVDSAKTWTLQATVRKLGHGNRIGLIVEKPNWRDDDNGNNLVRNRVRLDWALSFSYYEQ